MVLKVISTTNYSFIFPFETRDVVTNIKSHIKWTYSIYLSVLYLIVIFGGQKIMQDKQRFSLKTSLFVWNLGLAFFSIIGVCRTFPEFWHILTNYGFYHSVCNPAYITQDNIAAFWSLAFAVSKLPELGDTIFIVLRKQPLIFLHWFHHFTVFIYSWFSIESQPASGRWFITMNYFVHSIMYTYYALRAKGYRPPLQISMVITTLQTFQMVVGAYVNISVYYYLKNGVECKVTKNNLYTSLAMYTAYFMLFAWFFYKSYIVKKKAVRTEKVD